MLSVRRRQEDAGGAAGMADHAELEEGEAYGDDIPPFDDPDVTLAYIVSGPPPAALAHCLLASSLQLRCPFRYILLDVCNAPTFLV